MEMKVSVAKRPRHVKRKRTTTMGEADNDTETGWRGEKERSVSMNPGGRGKRGVKSTSMNLGGREEIERISQTRKERTSQNIPPKSQFTSRNHLRPKTTQTVLARATDLNRTESTRTKRD